MRKVLMTAAVASALLMTGTGTATAGTQESDWTARSSDSSASASGNYSQYTSDDTTMDLATGKLTVTDPNPKACYSFQVGNTGFSKPPRMSWGVQSAKQCGPGTITTSSYSGAGFWGSLKGVRICKNTQCDLPAPAGSAF